MTAAAQNIKRMVRLLAIKGPERVAAAVRMPAAIEMKLNNGFFHDGSAWSIAPRC